MKRIVLLILLGLLASLSTGANEFVFDPIDVSHGLSDNQVRYILQLPDGRMVFTTSGNVNLYDGARFQYIHRTDRHIHPLNAYDGFYRIYQSRDSLLWIKDYHKLMCIDLTREVYLDELDMPSSPEDLFVDSFGEIWLLTSPSTLYRTETDETFDLTGNSGTLQDIFVHQDCLYLFYNTGSVICYDLNGRRRLYDEPAYSDEEALLFKNTSLVVEGKDGFYQLRNGSKGGFFFFDPRSRTWEKLLETDYVLNTLIVTEEGTAYVSSAHGIWIVHPSAGEKQYLPVLKTVEGETIDTEISTLYQDKQGGLWLGTINRGLLYHHPDRYKLSHIGRSYFPETSTKDLIVQAFTEDESGKVFIKTSSGVYAYQSTAMDKPVLQPISLASLSKKVQEELSRRPGGTFQGNSYPALLTDSRGWTWAGTRDGLKLFRLGQEERVYYTENGLVNNFIHAILEDSRNNIWVTTSYGISQVEIDPTTQQVHFINYNVFDGTLEGEYADGAAYEVSDKSLYFGGVNGFNVWHPGADKTSDPAHKPLFVRLSLHGEPVEVGRVYDDRIILERVPPYTESITLAHNQNFLTLEFSALNYRNTYRTSYRYRLIGIDADWQEISVSEQNPGTEADGVLRVSYTNLPPGEYTFQVMASDTKHKGEDPVAELRLLILKPWWKTHTAYLLYILLILCFLFGVTYLYLYVSRKRTERQHKEEILLLRIRHLIEQCKLLESENESYKTKTVAEKTIAEECPDPTVDHFLSQAIELVEKNLNVPGYSVEQLSRDLCMERTGLYRKLTLLLDQSPSLFIRQIRLQRAAQLLLDGELSIAEITDRVGFSSSSYLSKCFQEMYGCRPSEYAGKMKKST
ncbi:helix-turn-helix domain-containing protein [Bacteroidales bacterium OttesenSCG-928-J19]|nr:helix-turn-helix domain-containing protein [Bacteroidales bacterium OttesenSCG-928-J19]